MVFLKEVVDRPRSTLGHVYFSLSDEEISSNESADIRLEKDGSIIRKTSLLMDLAFFVTCR